MVSEERGNYKVALENPTALAVGSVKVSLLNKNEITLLNAEKKEKIWNSIYKTYGMNLQTS